MRLDAALREAVSRRLDAWPVQRIAHGAHSRAAVAVALCEEGTGAQLPGVDAPDGWSHGAALILTRRAKTLGNHPGQWALPGGRVDDGESPQQAALRELAEEIGLRLPSDAVLGLLDDYATHSGFVITPVVVWAGQATALEPNAAEVASIHRIPVAEFMRRDAPLLEPSEDPARPVLRMPVGDGWIAAPTAAVLYQFREVCIAGRDTRVSHFEQPLFARR